MTNSQPSPAPVSPPNLDDSELRKFSALADTWWDPRGPNRPLHDLNPVRLDYVRSQLTLAGAEVLDVGCGGGLLSEALAAAGARVIGIDASPEMIAVAAAHSRLTGFSIDYRAATAEVFACDHAARFDAVTCMELLEHVPEPGSLIATCAQLLKPGGRLLLSTINRTLPAYLSAVLGAEYVLKLLPRGTHDYRKFIRPSEIDRWCRACGLRLIDLTGMAYEPWLRRARLRGSVSVNYLACAERDA